MFGRVYYGAHWIGDTIGGWLIGVAISTKLTPLIFKLIQYYTMNVLPLKLFQ